MAESSKGECGTILTCSRDKYAKILTCSRGEYEKILQAHGVNTRKYWLVEVIDNGCIVIRVRVYDEILAQAIFYCIPLLSSQCSYNTQGGMLSLKYLEIVLSNMNDLYLC